MEEDILKTDCTSTVCIPLPNNPNKQTPKKLHSALHAQSARRLANGDAMRKDRDEGWGMGDSEIDLYREIEGHLIGGV